MKTFGVIIILAAIVMAIFDAIIGQWGCVVVNVISIVIVAQTLYEIFKKE